LADALNAPVPAVGVREDEEARADDRASRLDGGVSRADDRASRVEAFRSHPDDRAADGLPGAFTIGGRVRVEPNFILAPMSGITDSAYRALVKELNPGAIGLVVTELISIEALARHDLRTHRMLRYRALERPLSIQLFGADPARMAEAAAIAADLGADVIDVNCGCPAPKVVKKGGGAGLMREPDVLQAVLHALRGAVTIPFTIKIRAGWDEASRNAVEVARMAEGEGAAMIAVHGRTRAQLYSGEPDWELTARVKQAVRIPVVGSGDVTTPAQALERLRSSGVDGVMIGRATLGHPWIFREIATLRAGLALAPVTLAERLAAIAALLVRLGADLPPESAVGRARGLACRMVKHVRGGAVLREALTRAPSLDAMGAILTRAAEEGAESGMSDETADGGPTSGRLVRLAS
jgi:tRNA-dihydrouridine synthase B